MSRENQKAGQLILEHSLQTFFFDQLQEVNGKSTNPVAGEVIYYSSLVMDKFGESKEYFDFTEGRPKDKILGMKLLATMQKSKTQQRRELQDIGDTALFLCGYFSESLNSKIIDTRYYQELGQIAYEKLDHLIPHAYEVPSFFKLMAKGFGTLTTMMSIVANRFQQTDDHDVLLIVGSGLKAS